MGSTVVRCEVQIEKWERGERGGGVCCCEI